MMFGDHFTVERHIGACACSNLPWCQYLCGRRLHLKTTPCAFSCNLKLNKRREKKYLYSNIDRWYTQYQKNRIFSHHSFHYLSHLDTCHNHSLRQSNYHIAVNLFSASFTLLMPRYSLHSSPLLALPIIGFIYAIQS